MAVRCMSVTSGSMSPLTLGIARAPFLAAERDSGSLPRASVRSPVRPMVARPVREYGARMRSFAARWGDLLLAGCFAALILIQGIAEAGSAVERLGAVAAALAAFVVLALRCRFPLVPLLIATALAVADIWLPTSGDNEAFGFIAVIAIYTAAAHTERD